MRIAVQIHDKIYVRIGHSRKTDVKIGYFRVEDVCFLSCIWRSDLLK